MINPKFTNKKSRAAVFTQNFQVRKNLKPNQEGGPIAGKQACDHNSELKKQLPDWKTTKGDHPVSSKTQYRHVWDNYRDDSWGRYGDLKRNGTSKDDD